MALPQRDTQHHTYGEYLTWSDDQRQELIDGIAYIKEPPAPSPHHQELVGGLYYQICTALEGKPCRAYIAPFDIRLPKSDEADEQIDTVVQPDVFILCDRHRVDRRGLRGAPDWLAEVLSPSTASHDRVIKLPVYERAGVREVWFIQPVDKTLAIYRLENGRYGRSTVTALKGQTSLTAVPGVSIDWDRLVSQLIFTPDPWA
jgi:Uma2 family endonuclease